MEIKKKTKQEEIVVAEENLCDLPVNEEEAEKTKGAEGKTRLVFGNDQGIFVS